MHIEYGTWVKLSVITIKCTLKSYGKYGVVSGFDYCLRMPLWLAIRMSDASMWALAACHIRTAEFFVYLFDSCYEL